MKRVRVLSTESKVYHRPVCRYVKRIQYANRMELMPKEAKQYGYKSCKCYNTMAYLYDTEWSSIDYFERKWDLQFCFKDGVVYVKTEISCWKLVYSRREEWIALYHLNASKVPVDFEHLENERYHRQNDCTNANSISAMCKYIYELDRFRDVQSKGQRLTTFMVTPLCAISRMKFFSPVTFRPVSGQDQIVDVRVVRVMNLLWYISHSLCHPFRY